jgi:SAM-dependent methyltransferase
MHRSPEFFDTFLRGRVIDIGCGDDPVVSWAEPFDKTEGDASAILSFRSSETYDCVYSSHCLEHMENVPEALGQWWKLVIPAGHMIIAVPDEDLYEQGNYPSIFNQDHKATFRYEEGASWSPKSYYLPALVMRLPDAMIVQYERQDSGYDHSLRRQGIGQWGRLIHKLSCYQRFIFSVIGITNPKLQSRLDHIYFSLGAPLDQTRRNALAQLVIIVKKTPKASSEQTTTGM